MQSLFGAPSMLWWGAAASIPVVIHLLSRRRYRRVPWAAMHFLERAFKRTRKRLRLENILLMLLRVAILLFLALALADPRTSGAGVLGGEQSRTVFMLIDNSFSMNYSDGTNRSPFEGAVDAARRVLDSLDSETDAAALLSLGGSARLHAPLTREIPRVAGALDQINLTHGGTDTIGALGVLSGLLQEPDLDREFPGPRTVYIFTDMQRSALIGEPLIDENGQPVQLDAPDPRVETLIRTISDADAEVIFVDTGSSNSERVPNVAVTELRHVGRSLVQGRTTEFECVLKNFGDENAGGEIQFFVDSESTFVQREVVSELKGRTTGTLAESERTFRFTAVINEPGWHYVAVRYVDDALGIDNIRRFAFEVRERIRVLAVDGNDSPEPEDSSVFFVARALDPQVGRTSTGSSAFDVKEVSTLDFRAEQLADYDLIVLANVAQLSASRVEALESWVREGGSLMFFAGRTFEVPGRLGKNGSTNTLFYRGGEGLMPFELGRARGADDQTANPYNLQFETFDHPAMRYFDDPRISPGVTSIPVYKFVETEAVEAEGVRVLASYRLAQKDAQSLQSWPAIVEKRVGDGLVMAFATSADKTWNLFGATPAYVPLMKECAYYLTRSANRDNIQVGDRLFARFPSSVDAVTVTIGEQAPINRKTSRQEGAETVSLALNRIDEACVVRIRPVEGSAAGVAERVIAVNIDPAESDLTRGGPGWMTAHLGTELVRTVSAGKELEVESSAQAESRIWRGFLYAVLAFLLLETLFARQFGREFRSETAAA